MDKQTKYEITSLILMAVVVTLTIGYSLLSSNLNINGSSSIKEASWDIHFENIQVKTGSVSASTPVIDTNKTTVTYNVTLTNPGDYYEFTVDVVNSGSIDAMIESVTSKMNDVEIVSLPNYLDYFVTYQNGVDIQPFQELRSGTTETLIVRVEYKRDVNSEDLPTTDQDLNMEFKINYTQATQDAISTCTLESDSLETIIDNVRNNTIPSCYTLGASKEVEIDGLGTFSVRIANKSTPAECSDSNFSQTACGFVLEFNEIVCYGPMNSTNTTKGGWKNSSGRTELNTSFYNKLPEALRNGIIQTKVVSGYATPHDSSNFVTQDKIYLLSKKEVWNYTATYDTAASLSRQLDYYESEGVNTSNLMPAIKRPLGGIGEPMWWLREPYVNSNTSTGFNISTRLGYYNASWEANGRIGFSPAFRIG